MRATRSARSPRSGVRGLVRRRRGGAEEGFAIVVALLITLISFVLATAVLAQAMHNVSQAGKFRRRTAAIHAAEAGLAWYSNLLSTAKLAQLGASGGWAPVSGAAGWWERTLSEVASNPDSATFRVRVYYTKTNVCTTLPCAIDSGTMPAWNLQEPVPEPLYVIVRSTGTAKGVSRTLESAVRLTRKASAGIPSSLGVIGTTLCFDTGGDLWIRNGGLHILDPPASTTPSNLPDPWPCAGLDASVGNGHKLKTDGNVYVDDRGLTVATSGAQLEIGGDLWAEGAVSLGGGGGGNANTVCASGDLCVHGDVYGTTVAIGSNTTVEGDIIQCTPACPPSTEPFPKLTADSSLWVNWDVTPVATASDALSLLGTEAPQSKTAYVVLAPTGASCKTVFNGTYTLQDGAKVAIISSCGFEIESGDYILQSGSGASLTLMSAWPGTNSSPDPQPSCSAGDRDIQMRLNPTVQPALFLYTPCKLYLENNSSNNLVGQFVARFMHLKQSTVLDVLASADEGVTVPGPLAGFEQDIRYIKEIVL